MTYSQIPDGLDLINKNKTEIWQEELIIDGNIMSVLEVVQDYRAARLLVKVWSIIGLSLAVCFTGAVYWYSSHLSNC